MYQTSDSLRRHERTCRFRNTTEEFNTNEFYYDPDEANEPKRQCYSIHTENISPILASGTTDLSGLSTFPVEPTPEQGDSTADHLIQTTDVNEGILTLCDESDATLPVPFLDADQYLLQNIPSPLDFSALDLLFSSQIDPDATKAERLEHLAYFTSSRGMSTFTDRETFQNNQKLVADDYKSKQEDAETRPESDPLFTKALELVQSLRNTITKKKSSGVITTDWSPATQTQCQEFFSSTNINRFLEYFWALWYPNCPIIHRPLFKACDAPPALLCVMVIIGAFLSPTKDDVQRARRWLDSAEELVFSHECFLNAQKHPDTTDSKDWLQCIQAGYLICSLQKREGSGATQARIRRYRHASMVTVS